MENRVMSRTKTMGNLLQRRFYRHTILSYTKSSPLRMDEAHRSVTGRRPSGSYGLTQWLVLLCICLFSSAAQAQDWVKTGTALGVEKVRLAVADFKPATNDAANTALLKTFNDTLWNDLDVSGVVELVSKSFYPLQVPGQPPDVNFLAWSAPPPNAGMLAFGNLGVSDGKLTTQGWLFDVKNTQSPQILGKQYSDTASEAAARVMAHKFADEIIFRLGGGVQGIAETQIYFVSDRTGHKEIWAMDYDGSNQHQLTRLASIALSPRISPDGSRLAFSALTKSGWEIMMYSLELSRAVSFARFGGTNLSPAWSADGSKLAFSSSRSGAPEIVVSDTSGGGLQRLTTGKGLEVSPVWNCQTNSEIAFVSGRTGLPQI